MQQSMACRTTPHSTPHDAAAGSYDSKTALAWREERERRRGQEPDSTCVTDLCGSVEDASQPQYSLLCGLNVDVECTCGASRLSGSVGDSEYAAL